jgi:hypothetical protein
MDIKKVNFRKKYELFVLSTVGRRISCIILKNFSERRFEKPDVNPDSGMQLSWLTQEVTVFFAIPHHS